MNDKYIAKTFITVLSITLAYIMIFAMPMNPADLPL